MKNESKQINWQDAGVLLAGLAWLASYFVGRAVTEADGVSVVLRVLAALFPIVTFAAFVYLIIRSSRGMDASQIRVQIEAFAIAFPLSILFLMVFGLLGEALDLIVERHVWFYLPVFYFVGLVVAIRRNR